MGMFRDGEKVDVNILTDLSTKKWFLECRLSLYTDMPLDNT
jgi:hypothetical protein